MDRFIKTRGKCKSMLIDKVNLILTNKCNLNCKYCYLGIPSSKNVNCVEDNFSSAISLINVLKLNKIQSILFTGGEPLLYRKLTSLLKYSGELQIQNSIYTNGFIPLRNVLAYVDTVYISLDGNKSIHNFLRGNTRSYDKIWNNINIINEYNTNNKRKINCKINCVVTSENIEYIKEDFETFLRDEKFQNVVSEVNLEKVSSEGETIKNKYLLVDDKQKLQIREIAKYLNECSFYRIYFSTNLYNKNEFINNFPSAEQFSLPVWVDLCCDNIYFYQDSPLYKLSQFKKWDNKKVSNNMINAYAKITSKIPEGKLFDPFELLNSRLGDNK